MKKRKQPWKLPLRGSEIFAGLGHIMDATNEVVLVAVVPKDGEPCADRLDARRECAIAAINSASAAQATISAANRLADACRNSGDESVQAALAEYLKVSWQ